PSFKVEGFFGIISRKSGLADALITAAIEKHVPGAAWFVSWNARHFKNCYCILTLTPRELPDRSS
ncbi:MAG TPA: hypothetical protein VLX11_14930, partial [Candidatus Acidoferrales bacterium]|nr:hypothetical protein [Candidatus Acidoferrales bacterium]